MQSTKVKEQKLRTLNPKETKYNLKIEIGTGDSKLGVEQKQKKTQYKTFKAFKHTN